MSVPRLLADVVKRFKTGTYTVTRRVQVAPVAGRAQAPTTTLLSVDASIQPATGRQLQRLPDGMRVSETIVIWTETELLVQTATQMPDLIAYKGGSYEVQEVMPFDELGSYYECLAVKV